MVVDMTITSFGFTRDVQTNDCDRSFCLHLQAVTLQTHRDEFVRWRILATFPTVHLSKKAAPEQVWGGSGIVTKPTMPSRGLGDAKRDFVAKTTCAVRDL